MDKLKIYYLLSKEAYLEPISGDRINEINIIKALSRYFSIYYNGELCDSSAACFGRSDKRIVTPKKGEYDLVYIRANREVFLDSPSPKVWFASPYDKECFEEADGIACMTKPWQNRLSSYTEGDYKYFVEMYPKDMDAPKHCLLFPQVIVISPTAGRAVSSKSISPVTKITSLFRKAKPDFKLRHFGPVRPSNVPHQLCHYMSTSSFFQKTFDAVAVGAGKKVDLGASITKVGRLPQAEAFDLLVSSDAVWYNQDLSGNVAGSLKVLEAMAVGTPILLPRYDARVSELGDEYPFFWDIDAGTSITDPVQTNFVEIIKRLSDISQYDRNDLSGYLKSRAEEHSIENVSGILRDQICDFMDNYCEK